MPFTFSHPAAALPLARWLRLSPSALFVGSLSPDFIYFLQLRASGEFGHTLPGLFLFCLPLSLLVLWLWHRVVKGPAVALLPAWAARRAAQAAAEPYPFGPGRRMLAVCTAVLVGAVTHDVWDAFTHQDGWVALHWPVLLRELPFPGFGTMPVYKLGQLGSTAVGGLLLAWWSWRWLRRQPPAPTAPALAGRIGWLATLLIGAAVLAVSYARWVAPPLESYLALRLFVLSIIVAFCSALWVGLLLFGWWYQQKAGPTGPALVRNSAAEQA
ncbi:DUF4184 family protein [Hymenobacter sp. CRA2]|uniref:DUF4184 family protein n=1 Tax=Hymenobacter sp. CRA2 TaxID=1955620 RepID=UPI0009C56A66|nr:DUF4184 family protein [Hymenobacter sp. CRA2]OON69336.1 hypothetical protein B0919_08600 [Hymenobacter sp. CRA2]